MDRSTNFTESKSCTIKEKREQQKIQDIYIGVFFDGTNNNMNRVSTNDVKKRLDSESQKDADKEYISKKKNNFVIFKSLYNAATSIPNDQTLLSKIKVDQERMADEDYKREIEINQIVSTSDNFKLDLNEQGKKTYKGEKYSNIAFLTSLYKGNSESGNHKVLNVYMEGAGATAFTDNGKSNNVGLALGIGVTGVVAIVSRAMIFINRYLESLSSDIDKDETKIHFDVFGFSRGATCARVFSYMVCKGQNLMERGKEFTLYLKNSNMCDSNGRCKFLEGYKNVVIDFLGIYDTVASIGMLEIRKGDSSWHSKFEKAIDCNREDYVVNGLYNTMMKKDQNESLDEASEQRIYLGLMKYSLMEVRNNFHKENSKNYGLFSPHFIDKIKNVLHIGAIDEFRENFAFTNIGSEVPDNAIEVLIPGCHSDIGGGYVDGDKNLVTLALGVKYSERLKLRKNGKVYSRISMSYPGESTQSDFLSIEALKKLGWIWIDDNKSNIVSNSVTGMHSSSIPEDYDKVQFWNEGISEGYSNIPLEMMVTHVKNKIKDRSGVFSPLTHPRVKIPDRIHTDMVEKLTKCATGARYCFYPDNQADYQVLRRTYLHFTASDELNWGIHKNNYGNILDANAPYRKEGTIGRLMYMGGEGDDNSLYFLNSTDCNFKRVGVKIKVSMAKR